jgi:hypothetical protein
MRDTTVNRPTVQPAPATSQTSLAGEQTGQMAQAFKRAAVDHAHIAQRAYELYKQRGRQEGRDLEDWLKAERELGGAVHHA